MRIRLFWFPLRLFSAVAMLPTSSFQCTNNNNNSFNYIRLVNEPEWVTEDPLNRQQLSRQFYLDRLSYHFEWETGVRQKSSPSVSFTGKNYFIHRIRGRLVAGLT